MVLFLLSAKHRDSNEHASSSVEPSNNGPKKQSGRCSEQSIRLPVEGVFPETIFSEEKPKSHETAVERGSGFMRQGEGLYYTTLVLNKIRLSLQNE